MKNLKDSIKVDHNYDKNKSFLSFQRSKNNQEKINTLIKKALIDKNLISTIDKKHVHIIKDLKEDLIENKKTINKIKFEFPQMWKKK